VGVITPGAGEYIVDPAETEEGQLVGHREKQIWGSEGLTTPGPLSMQLHTVFMEYAECLPTLLTPPPPCLAPFLPG
jgi:hypothetical protein